MTSAAAPFVVVLVAHPRTESYTRALAARATDAVRAAGGQPTVHDLYVDGFDPLLQEEESRVSGPEAARPVDADPVVGRYRRELAEADALVVVHPNWWGKPPAAISGWLDRVLVPGVAYRLASPGALPRPLLRIRHLLIVNTTETPPVREESDMGDPLEDIWRRCVAAYLGPQGQEPRSDRLVLAEVTAVGQGQRVAWLDEIGAAVEEVVRSLQPE